MDDENVYDTQYQAPHIFQISQYYFMNWVVHNITHFKHPNSVYFPTLSLTSLQIMELDIIDSNTTEL